MFVVFEGIDGGGKTTLSNLVASRLREGGLVVEHVREGGTFASSVTQAMRELGRDARNLALSPRAELMLYLTREIQLLDEATRPALARADVVIADRFVATAEVLAVHGRGLPAAEVAPLVTAATGGLEPELTILVDVDPRIARARRRVSKLVSQDVKPPSRKGLAGTALQLRLRHGYRELAAAAPERWLVVDNTDADLAAMAEMIAIAIRHARTVGVAAARAHVQASAHAPVTAHDLASARAALLAWIDRRAEREPGLAAYFLDGLAGPDFDARRRALAPRAPRVIAAGLAYLTDAVSWQLRRELMASAPDEVAGSLVGPAALDPEAEALLRALAASAPRAVGEVLAGRTDDLAWELRAGLPLDAAMASLGHVDEPRAWAVRERWLADHGGVAGITDVATATLACASVDGVAGPRAWELRRELRALAPVAALVSTVGLVDDRAWKWRERFVARAPKVVMKSITGLDDPRAWALRERVAATCEEVLDTILGSDDPRAWALREALAGVFPPSVLKSLGPLAATARGQALIAATLEHHPTDVAVWRQVAMRGG